MKRCWVVVSISVLFACSGSDESPNQGSMNSAAASGVGGPAPAAGAGGTSTNGSSGRGRSDQRRITRERRLEWQGCCCRRGATRQQCGLGRRGRERPERECGW